MTKGKLLQILPKLLELALKAKVCVRGLDAWRRL